MHAGGAPFPINVANAVVFCGWCVLRFLQGAGLDVTWSGTMANSARRSFAPSNGGSAMLPCTRTSEFSCFVLIPLRTSTNSAKSPVVFAWVAEILKPAKDATCLGWPELGTPPSRAIPPHRKSVARET